MKRELVELACFMLACAALGWLTGALAAVVILAQHAPILVVLGLGLVAWLMLSVAGLFLFRLIVPPREDQ